MRKEGYSETTTDLTIPEPAKLMTPVSYARLHNVKGSIKRRIKQLGLENQVTVETRQRKLLIMKKLSRAASPTRNIDSSPE